MNFNTFLPSDRFQRLAEAGSIDLVVRWQWGRFRSIQMIPYHSFNLSFAQLHWNESATVETASISPSLSFPILKGGSYTDLFRVRTSVRSFVSSCVQAIPLADSVTHGRVLTDSRKLPSHMFLKSRNMNLMSDFIHSLVIRFALGKEW